MNREVPGEAAMKFQARDLMSNVLPREMAEQRPDDTTTGRCIPPCLPPSCPGGSGCPQPSEMPPKMGQAMLSVLRDQMRLALLPA